MSEPLRSRYRQHLEVETPEHVVLDYEIAGIGSRALAKFLDSLILVAITFAFALGFALWRQVSTWVVALQILVGFVVFWGYFTFCESVLRGRTPGKRWMGVRVIRDTGHGVGFADAALRNLLLPADLFGLAGAFFVALHPRAKRLGDLAAGTVVVRDHPTRKTARAEPEPATVAGAPELSGPEFRLLREFVQRRNELPPRAVERHTRVLVERLGRRYPNRPANDLAFLEALYREETGRRQGRFGGAAAARQGGSAAERMVARKSGRWTEFHALAERVTRNGLDALSARELPEFAARYREVAADLARARTYGADDTTLARLTRLVAAGHNALYRSERQTWRGIRDFLAHQCPAAVVQARREVALAGGLFLLAAGAGYGLLRERPDLAPELLPDVVLERAEAGAGRTASGAGYVVSERSDRPIVASSIITNNIGVAFRCFAGGIFLGFGALVMLAYNGVFLGAVSAHFANAGLLRYLWTFVVGHSILELFAIWVSGAAGFLLGRSVIAPGEVSRGDALVLAGRQAVRMVAAAVVMLVIAGTIEGFVSAGEFPLGLRLAVSGASLVFLVWYLCLGVRGRGSGSGVRGDGLNPSPLIADH
jgi:uncharacterized membrane protein SpoIIM required for sporulation/uncharacterized RDD family membrane protein YckC